MHESSKLNILMIMADQVAAQSLSLYGNSVCKTPNLERLAARGVVFKNAYTPSPLCAPARASLMTGRLSPNIQCYDNASELSAAQPCIPHFLGHLGYHSILCGKMHFVGPDQVHGFNERITTDIYPANFSWMPNWEKGPSFISSGVTLSSVVEAGPCVRNMQMDYDDEVEYQGIQKIYDLARTPEHNPFFMTISFTNPHTPFTISQHYWDMYPEDAIDLPSAPEVPFESLDYHSKGLYFAHGRQLHDVSRQNLIDSRRAYYGMISYIDDKVGNILDALEDTGLADNTVVCFVSDHGEMLGERGMWYKHHFWEWSAHVPMIMAFPDGRYQGECHTNTSLIDVLPTCLEIAANGAPLPDLPAIDGISLLDKLTAKDEASDTVISDYLAIGPCVPCRMVKRGAYKLMYTHGHPPMLFNIDNDPTEQHNLAGDQNHQDTLNELIAIALDGYDPEELTRKIIDSQRDRIFISKSHDDLPTWAYIRRAGDEGRFVRSAKVDDTKARLRLPRVESVPYHYHPIEAEDVDRLMAGDVSLDQVRIPTSSNTVEQA